MVSEGGNVSRLIRDARQAAPGALDQLLASYRNYLRLLARTGIDQSLQGKADPSDRRITAPATAIAVIRTTFGACMPAAVIGSSQTVR